PVYPLAHVGDAGSEPDPSAARRPDHRAVIDSITTRINCASTRPRMRTRPRAVSISKVAVDCSTAEAAATTGTNVAVDVGIDSSCRSRTTHLRTMFAFRP